MAGAAITGTLVLGVTTTSYAFGWFGFGNQKESGITTDTFDFSQNAGGTQNNNGFGGRQGFGGQDQAGTGMQQGFGMQGGMDSSNVTLADSPSEIVTGSTTNSAQNLKADTANAITYVMSDSNNSVKISDSGTYIITGTCSDGNITVKKGTTGVVLVLHKLLVRDLAVGVLPDDLKRFGQTYALSANMTGTHGSAAHEHSGKVEPCRRQYHSRNYLSAEDILHYLPLEIRQISSRFLGSTHYFLPPL